MYHVIRTPLGPASRMHGIAVDRSGPLVKNYVCFFHSFCLKLGDAHTRAFPRCQELLKSQAKSPKGVGKKVPIFATSQNPAPPCCYSPYFLTCSFHGEESPSGNPDLGQNGSKNNTYCCTTRSPGHNSATPQQTDTLLRSAMRLACGAVRRVAGGMLARC